LSQRASYIGAIQADQTVESDHSDLLVQWGTRLPGHVLLQVYPRGVEVWPIGSNPMLIKNLFLNSIVYMCIVTINYLYIKIEAPHTTKLQVIL
jgi:hypothetical protein